MRKKLENLPNSGNDPPFTDLAQRVKALKRREQLTAGQLAQRAGVPVGTLNKILSGETKRPSLESIQRIAQAFQVPLRYFVDELTIGSSLEDGMTLEQGRLIHVSQEEYKLIEGLRKISQRERRLINSAIQTRVQLDAEVLEGGKMLELPYWVPTCMGQNGIVADAMVLYKIAVRDSPVARHSDFALLVRGDALVPAYYPGTVLGVADADVCHDQLGVFQLNGEVYARRFYCRRQVRKLVAINRQCPVVVLEKGDCPQCLGRVVGSLTPCRPSVKLK